MSRDRPSQRRSRLAEEEEDMNDVETSSLDIGAAPGGSITSVNSCFDISALNDIGNSDTSLDVSLPDVNEFVKTLNSRLVSIIFLADTVLYLYG